MELHVFGRCAVERLVTNSVTALHLCSITRAEQLLPSPYGVVDGLGFESLRCFLLSLYLLSSLTSRSSTHFAAGSCAFPTNAFTPHLREPLKASPSTHVQHSFRRSGNAIVSACTSLSHLPLGPSFSLRPRETHDVSATEVSLHPMRFGPPPVPMRVEPSSQTASNSQRMPTTWVPRKNQLTWRFTRKNPEKSRGHPA